MSYILYIYINSSNIHIHTYTPYNALGAHARIHLRTNLRAEVDTISQNTLLMLLFLLALLDGKSD